MVVVQGTKTSVLTLSRNPKIAAASFLVFGKKQQGWNMPFCRETRWNFHEFPHISTLPFVTEIQVFFSHSVE